MIYIDVHDCNENVHKCPVYTPYDIPLLDIFGDAQIVHKRNDAYLNIPVTFDIESTTISSVDKPYAFMYCWQMCFIDKVVFGRTWEELQHLFMTMAQLAETVPSLKWVVYVHNLSYEFMFMYRFIHITSIFARDVGKPITVRTAEHIEFRCSYFLSNMSLSKFCQNTQGCTFWKRDGDAFDYSKLRTPSTILTPLEDEYRYCDVRGLAQCIEAKMKDDDLATIPITSTGYVRREFRDATLSNPNNKKLVSKLALDSELYKLCQEAFRGGDVSSNTIYVGEILENVHSHDLKSSYPAWMLTRKFPMTKFARVNPMNFKKALASGKACLFRCKLIGVKQKSYDTVPYISSGKALGTIKGGRVGNGRVLSCDEIKLTLTDIDWKIIEHEYEIEHLSLDCLYISEYDYLPEEFRTELFEYFVRKCELGEIVTDDLDDNYYIYMRFKNMINSAYGMMVTDIASDDISFDGDEWTAESNDIDTMLSRYYKSSKSFLSYQHGIWVTAWARYELRRAMWMVGRDEVYNDTDSVKSLGEHDSIFEELNREQITILETMNYVATTKSGSKYYIGTWEEEKTADEFITMGSKKYLCKYGDKYKATIAGVNKERASKWFALRTKRKYIDLDGNVYYELNDGCEAFKEGLVIPYDIARRNIAYYNYDAVHTCELHTEKFTSAANIALVNGEYTLGITDTYKDILRWLKLYG